MQAATGERPKRRENEVDGTGAAGPDRKPAKPYNISHETSSKHGVGTKAGGEGKGIPAKTITADRTFANGKKNQFWVVSRPKFWAVSRPNLPLSHDGFLALSTADPGTTRSTKNIGVVHLTVPVCLARNLYTGHLSA